MSIKGLIRINTDKQNVEVKTHLYNMLNIHYNYFYKIEHIGVKATLASNICICKNLMFI